MGMTSWSGGLSVTTLQSNPVSSVHVELQPSPDVKLPSSHASCGNLSPSPHTGVHCPPAHFGSMVQVGEQPSYGIRLWSSHCSKPSNVESPQTVPWQTVVPLVVVHANPGSSLRVELHPSLEPMLPSSHCSLPAMMP